MSTVIFLLALTLSNQAVAADTDCHLERDKSGRPDRATVHFRSMSIPVSLNAPDAKLVSCEKSKDFPNLLVVELDLGGAGTKTITHQTDLIVFDISKERVNKVFQKMIREVNEGQSNEKGFEEHYKIEKAKSGKPLLHFLDSNQDFEIKN